MWLAEVSRTLSSGALACPHAAAMPAQAAGAAQRNRPAGDLLLHISIRAVLPLQAAQAALQETADAKKKRTNDGAEEEGDDM